MNKPLFEYYPQLKGTIPALDFAHLPTPVQNISSLNQELSQTSNIWIKRDDQSHSLYGGNKVRKLEFILAQAKEADKNHILTFGALGTNHGVATSLFAKEFGLSTEVILFDQPLTPVVLNNLKLMHSIGTTLNYRKKLRSAALHFYLRQLQRSPRTYPLFAGGSNIAGCLGFVNAAFELKDQVSYRVCPEPDYIYCPVGSSATLAGLSLGCKLAGLRSQVIGVRVAPSHLGPIPTCTTRTVTTLMTKTYNFLHYRSPRISLPQLPDITLNDDYYGSGYGCETKTGTKAKQFFSRRGITLEDTYTAKAAAALLAHASEAPDKRFLFWHTFNSQDLSGMIAKDSEQTLPKRLRRLISKHSV